MPKNVLIFCDGTGQVGGVHFRAPHQRRYHSPSRYLLDVTAAIGDRGVH